MAGPTTDRVRVLGSLLWHTRAGKGNRAEFSVVGAEPAQRLVQDGSIKDRRGERWVRRPLPGPAPHELQGPILSFRTLPSATACSRGVGEPGTGAEVVQDQFFTGTGRACGRKK